MSAKNEKNKDESKKESFSRLFGGSSCCNVQIVPQKDLELEKGERFVGQKGKNGHENKSGHDRRAIRKYLNVTMLLVCGAMLFAAGCSARAEGQKIQSSSPQANTTEVAAQSTAEAAMQGASEENKYLFLVFYKQGDPKSEVMKQVAAKAQKEMAVKANIAYVDFSDESEQTLIGKLGIDESFIPITVVVAPNGAIVTGFPEEVSIEDLQNAFVSPAMAEILKAMQDGKLVYLYIANPRMDYYEENLTIIQATAKEDFPDSASIVEVDPENAAEADVIQRANVDVPLTKPKLLILRGGYIVGDLSGKIDQQTLVEASTRACSGGSCCPKAE